MQRLLKSRLFPFLITFLLLAAVFLLYFQTLDNPLIFDDLETFKRLLRQPLQPINLLWSVFGIKMGRFLSIETFVWINTLTNKIEYQRFFNIFIHAVNCLLCYDFISKIFRDKRTATFCSLFFAINPFSIYAVAYLVQRNILLATLFSLAQAILFLKSLNAKTLRISLVFFMLSLICWLIAIASKEQATAMLLSYPILSAAARFNRRSISYSVIIFAASIAFLSTLGLMKMLSLSYPIDVQAYISNTALIRLACGIPIDKIYSTSFITQSVLFFGYFLHWFIPLDTSIDMRFPFLTNWLYTIPIIIFIFISFFLMKKEETRILGAGFLLAFLLFIPEFTQLGGRIGEQFVPYRAYLYQIGFILILGWCISYFWDLQPSWRYFPFFILPIIANITSHRLLFFESQSLGWGKAASMLTNKTVCQGARIYNNYGTSLLLEGKVIEGLANIKRSVEIYHENPSSLSNLATAYFRAGQIGKAEFLFNHIKENYKEFKLIKEMKKDVSWYHDMDEKYRKVAEAGLEKIEEVKKNMGDKRVH